MRPGRPHTGLLCWVPRVPRVTRHLSASTLRRSSGSVKVARLYCAGQYPTIDPSQFTELQSLLRELERSERRREPPRAYSMSSAPHERHVAVTIKGESLDPRRHGYPPLLSRFLVQRLSAGDRLIVAGFLGGYTLSDDVETTCDHVLHLCAGSGSVPNVSILKDSLKRQARLRHVRLRQQDLAGRDLPRRAHRARAAACVAATGHPLPHARSRTGSHWRPCAARRGRDRSGGGDPAGRAPFDGVPVRARPDRLGATGLSRGRDQAGRDSSRRWPRTCAPSSSFRQCI